MQTEPIQHPASRELHETGGDPTRAPRRKNLMRLLLAATCLAMASTAAHAVESGADQPINIEADSWDHQGVMGGDDSVSVYTGHVVITQGRMRIKADKARLTIQNGALANTVITGSPAHFRQDKPNGPPVIGHALQIDYDTRDNVVVLTGEAFIQRGGKQVSANFIRYNIKKTRITAHRDKKKQGRVHITIPPAEGDPH